MSDDNSPREEPTLSSPITRRTAIGVLGASAVGLGAAGNVSAAAVSSNRFEITDDGPNPMPIVDSEGADLPEEPGEEMELFDAEPEFPPFVSFEMMDEEFGEAAERYLQPHGAESLLSSRRLAVHPEGEPLTWGDFDGASAHAHVEPAVDHDHRCSHVEIEFEGLVPDGVYTIWAVHRPAFHRPLGGNHGEANYFTADGEGNATLEVVDMPDELTLPLAATADPGDEEEGMDPVDPIPVTEYPLHEIPGEFFFVVAYHYDNRTWGPQPGPFWLPQLVVNQFHD